jgi:hypothetical protein
MKKIIYFPSQILLSYNARRAVVKGTIVAAVTAVIYLAIVVITTPSLPATAAINAAFRINSTVIFGLAIGVEIQFFLTSYSKGLGCRLDKKRKGIFGGGSGSTALSSFFSFFSLVPLGCCGSWLLILSMLPSIFGSSLSVVLIEYSKLLSYIGLVMVFGFAGLSALQLRKELQQRRLIEKQDCPDGWGTDIWFLIEAAMLGYNIKEVFLGNKEHTSFEDYREDISKLGKMAEQVEITIIREAIKHNRLDFLIHINFNCYSHSKENYNSLLKWDKPITGLRKDPI